MKTHSICVGVAVLIFGLTRTIAAADTPLAIDITHTKIEDLLMMDVTSVSRTEESLREAPSAIYVITNEDIRRSGARSIPEALRHVPGIQVARIDANKWAVTARGFNSRTANKLLVLIDGRSVYDPLFSGVLWETKDVMLDDVERIEVIRGPGGTLWGANAVNGVINIITKHAKETQNGLLSAGGGYEERGFGELRYGTALGEDQFLRVYSKYLNRDSGWQDSQVSDDDSEFGQGGFRFDASDERDSYTLQGDYYDGQQGNANNRLMSDQETSGGNLLFRWNRRFSPESEFSFLSYYDHTEIDTSILGEKRDTFSVEMQQVMRVAERHRIVTGLNYRYTDDQMRNSQVLMILPDERTDHLITGFIEDRIDLIKDEMFFTIGTKIERNSYSGVEHQPSVSYSWLIDDNNSVWGKISRAVRVPSRLEDDTMIALPNSQVFSTARNMDSEKLIAYELGYRFRPRSDVLIDLTAFFNAYDDLLSTEGLTVGNQAEGDAYGAEAAVAWNPLANWQLKASYSHLHMDLSLNEGSLDNPSRVEAIEGAVPQNVFSAHSSFDLGSRWDIDAALRYVDSLSSLDVGSYIVADIRLAYHLSDALEISVVGQNLFDRHHFEQSGNSSTAVEQGVYGQIRWKFGRSIK